MGREGREQTEEGSKGARGRAGQPKDGVWEARSSSVTSRESGCRGCTQMNVYGRVSVREYGCGCKNMYVSVNVNMTENVNIIMRERA